MTGTSGSGSSPVGNTSERGVAKEGGLRVSDVLAGGIASAVAAVVGGSLGAVGSVASAFVVSVVAGIVLPLLRRPLRTGEEKLHTLAGRDATPNGRDTKPSAEAPDEKVGQTTDAAPTEPSTRRNRRVRVAVITALVAFLVAFAAIFVVQAFSGRSLSTGTGQLQGQVAGGDRAGGAAGASATSTGPVNTTQPSASSTASTTASAASTRSGAATTSTASSDGETVGAGSETTGSQTTSDQTRAASQQAQTQSETASATGGAG
ncbi:hypothetical protein GCM10009785_30560 [Brooklawnia cerclae]|uniref:Uncharacterized protein n=1 Tax=Brooklawnia cerclae TaxID=349934 RepID=A0ABX0SE37_9ACTN|nr:hypothetical protein [Brooklawnia cerclae]NIH56653.1 hypothetical protein [Brooklawnia cerclae]